MSAPAVDTAATGGGRFDIPAGADPAAVLAAVRRGIFQVCKEHLAAELKRLHPVLASGPAPEAVAAVRAVSLAVDEAAGVVAEADAVLRLQGLADDAATGWSERRGLLEGQIKHSRLLLAAMERSPPESTWMMLLRGVVGELSLVSGFAKNWCSWPPLPASYRARPALTPAVVDDLASGIEAVQVSAQQ